MENRKGTEEQMKGWCRYKSHNSGVNIGKVIGQRKGSRSGRRKVFCIELQTIDVAWNYALS